MINIKKRLIGFAICSFILSGCIFSSKCYAQTSQCLIVSDIHLNPFYVLDKKKNIKIDSTLLYTLGKAPIHKWAQILAKYATKNDIDSSLSGYDSNYALLRSALANMHKQLPKPTFIIIAGDFIWHEKVSVTKNGKSRKLDMKKFDETVLADTLKAKTIRFIAKMFGDTFPGIPIIPTLGNNDSDIGDYKMPSTGFLASFAKSWQHNNSQMLKSKTFASAGYYTYVLNNKLKFVVLSTTLFSVKNTVKKDTTNANNMSAWIGTSLSNAGSGVWIVSHIPAGSQMQNNYSNPLIGAVAKNTKKVNLYIAGHTHFNDFRVICDATGNNASAYIRVVPSIGTNHGNNPSFEIADLDANYRVTKETTYYLGLQHLPHHIKPDSICWNVGYSINTVGLQAITAAAMLTFIKSNLNNPPASYGNFHNVGATLPAVDLSKELKKDILLYKPKKK
jgi:sphingomyelin phosphodiesterase acid-like 3